MSLDYSTDSTSRVYLTTYTVDGEEKKPTNIIVTGGYSTLGDIPKILAVKHFASNDSESVARIEILMIELNGRIPSA